MTGGSGKADVPPADARCVRLRPIADVRPDWPATLMRLGHNRLRISSSALGS